MLRTRVATASVLLAGFGAILFLFPPWLASIVFAGVAALAGWEWAGMMGLSSGRRKVYAFGIFALCVLFWTRPQDGFLILWVLSAFFWLFFAPRMLLARQITVCPTLGVLLLVPTWAAIVELLGKSPWLLIAVMALAWVADIGAFFVGRRWGRHKLAYAISPGKTWEGAGGAVVAVMAYGFLVQEHVPGLPVMPAWLFAILLMLATVLAIIGDLLESLAKRAAGVKDSSALLPGHGGVLDRIDSQTALLPLAALALRWGS
ncbi:MAG: phosphatidate cytidylyltransferase [Rhodocyclaceae bacterium]|nr:phosphatidate cytidylyltransferase [Rhodocyclaceae bacterium]